MTAAGYANRWSSRYRFRVQGSAFRVARASSLLVRAQSAERIERGRAARGLQTGRERGDDRDREGTANAVAYTSYKRLDSARPRASAPAAPAAPPIIASHKPS